MKLSYFSYDFWECCCEAVNVAVCVGTFRCVSAVLLAVWSTACTGATCCVRPGCLVPHGCSGRRRPRPPARLGGLTAFGAAPRSTPVPSGPSGTLHTCGAWCAACGSARRLVVRPGPPPTGTAARPTAIPQYSRPELALLIAESTLNFACNSPKSLSNFEIRPLELQRFHASLKLHPIELHATFLGSAPDTTTGTAAWPPHPRLGHTSAKKFAQHRQNCPKSALFRQQGELFRGLAQNPPLLGEFFRADGCRSHLTAPTDHPA